MKCAEFQRLICSTKTDELQPSEKEFLANHLARCPSCAAVYTKISEADQVLSRLKEAIPRIRNEQALTESILSAMTRRKTSSAIPPPSFLEYLLDAFNRKYVRVACVLVVFLSGMSYLAMEYNDATALVNLEQRLGNNTNVHYASLLRQEINIIHFLQGLYQFSTGANSSVELTNTLVLMKKTDLRTLLQGYETLDGASQKRLMELWNDYKEKEPSFLSNQNNREEIIALRKEIRRLQKELDRYSQRNTLP